MTKFETFEAAARSWLETSAYLWGGNGEKTDEISDLDAHIRRRETADGSHTKEQNVARVWARINALFGAGVESVFLGDCSGFILWCLRKAGFDVKDMTAASIYGKTTHITKDKLQAGDLLFRHNGTKVSHVGAYLGNGVVIENLGRDTGVVLTKLGRTMNGGAYWNRFGQWRNMRDASEQVTEQAATEEVVEGVGDAVVVTGTGLSVCVRLSDQRDTNGVLIGKAIGVARSGDSFPYIATMPSGWFKIDYEDTEAYISYRYTKRA